MDVSFAAAVLTVALGCGLLVGIERERRKGQGPGRAFAGLRSFTLASVLGATAALTKQPVLMAIGALFLAALGVVAHVRDRSKDPGITTEIAFVLTYLIGAMCVWSMPLAAAMAVGLTGLLAARNKLHRFANQWLLPGEVRDGITLCALVLIALPLMPNRPYWGPVLNPYLITKLLALLLSIQSLAHLGRRLLEAQQAVALSSIASGFVSSSAAIASMGLEVRAGRFDARFMAGAGLLSCVATPLLVWVIALTVQPAWGGLIWWPLLSSSLLALLWGAWLVHGTAPSSTERERPARLLDESGNMFSLRQAAVVVALLTGVQVLVHGLGLWLGQAGTLTATFLAALADLHSAVAAVLIPATADTAGVALRTVMWAFVAHGFSKLTVAWFAGGWRYLAWIAPGVAAHTAVGAVGLAWVM